VQGIPFDHIGDIHAENDSSTCPSCNVYDVMGHGEADTDCVRIVGRSICKILRIDNVRFSEWCSNFWRWLLPRKIWTFKLRNLEWTNTAKLRFFPLVVRTPPLAITIQLGFRA
jgi:hypothetical protein